LLVLLIILMRIIWFSYLFILINKYFSVINLYIVLSEQIERLLTYG